MVADYRVAVFFDVDNLWLSARDAGVPFDVTKVMQASREQGIVVVARAYADWAASKHLVPEFHRHAIEMIELASGYGRKNTADIQIATDAMEIALSQKPPDAIVLVSGDRDFVPLVQKLRRYGIRMVAVGVEGTVSGVLQRACDAFLSYVDFFPRAPSPAPLDLPIEEEVADNAVPDPADAFPLLLRAVRVALQHDAAATDAVVHQLMREIDPKFTVDSFGVSFRALAERAQAAGWVSLREADDDRFVIELRNDGAGAPGDVAGGDATAGIRFDNPEDAANGYRAILMAKRVPLLPFDARSKLVHHLWQAFDDARPRGMSFAMMTETMSAYTRRSDLNVPIEGVKKLTYTLNIARCLSQDGQRGQFYRTPDMVYDYFLPVVDAETAINEIHRTYLTGIKIERPSIDLDPEAVALLLFDSREPWAIRQAASLVQELQDGRRVVYRSTPIPEPLEQVRLAASTELLQAMQDAVASIRRGGGRATGAAVRTAMAESYIPFQMFAASRLPFKQLAQLASEKGYVRIVEHPGTDFELLEPSLPNEQ